MTVRQRDDSRFWWFEFEFNKKRYQGSTGCTNKRDAEAFEAEKKKEAKADAKVDGRTRIQLGALTDEWLKVTSIADGRDITNDASRVRKLFGEERQNGKLVLGARFGLSRDQWLHTLAMRDLSDLKLARIDEENAPGTINKEIALVQALLSYAETRGYVAPALKVASLRFAKKDGKLRYFTVDEELALLADLAARASSLRCHATRDNLDLAIALLDTGARYNEMATIQWSQIGVDIDIGRLKGGQGINPHATDRLAAVLAARKAAAGTRRYVFPAMNGHVWAFGDKPRGYAVTAIRDSMDRVGLNAPELVEAYGTATVHTFRDTFASRLVQAGESLYVVQRLLGHSDPQMTQKYAKLAPSKAAAGAVAALNRIHGAPVAPLAIVA